MNTTKKLAKGLLNMNLQLQEVSDVELLKKIGPFQTSNSNQGRKKDHPKNLHKPSWKKGGGEGDDDEEKDEMRDYESEQEDGPGDPDDIKLGKYSSAKAAEKTEMLPDQDPDPDTLDESETEEDNTDIDEDISVYGDEEDDGGKPSATKLKKAAAQPNPGQHSSTMHPFSDEEGAGEEAGEEAETDYNEDEDEPSKENYLQKFSSDIRDNFILNYHPEAKNHNYEEVRALARVMRDEHTNIINDPLHKTLPFLTKYEKTRVLGQRARQINAGSLPLVKIFGITDGYLIAIMELEQKKLPFIIKRPIPSGGCEYWNISDLELI